MVEYYKFKEDYTNLMYGLRSPDTGIPFSKNSPINYSVNRNFDLIATFQPFYIFTLVSIPMAIYTSFIFENMGTIWIAIKDMGTFRT